MNFDPVTFFILATAFTPLVVLLAAVHIDRERRESSERPPQTEKLLRPAGHSLALQLDEIFDRMIFDILKAALLGAMSGVFITITYRSFELHAPVWWLMICILFLVLFIAACSMATSNVFKNFQKGRNIRLGLRGEQAVAEALAAASLFGYRAFHDLCDEKVGNIDHVAVGTRGVFVIETKARRRRPSRNGQPEHHVIYKGDFLQFPYCRESKPIEQAKINAKWLSNFLQNETGEAVWVEPVVVLPGWYVPPSEKKDLRVKVMNATYLAKYLQALPEKIEPAQVLRIVNALDKKCRNIEF